MLGENKSLKDPERPRLGGAYGAGTQNMSVMLTYTKTNKLIAGLYMVTDIMDKEEPIRLKLRTLGVEIISDINSFSVGNLDKKIHEILSFLDIASVVGIISQMNHGILKKEFLQLRESIKEAMEKRGAPSLYSGQTTLSDFMKTEIATSPSIGHITRTRIGVQKGHTLMKALSKLEVSDRILASSVGGPVQESFNGLKKERREQIIKIVGNNPNGATITDIKTSAQGSLASCGEKTLQRELFSMVKDNVLNKTGEKRWSRYFLHF